MSTLAAATTPAMTTPAPPPPDATPQQRYAYYPTGADPPGADPPGADPPGRYMLDKEEVWQRSARASGRTTAINSFVLLTLSGLTFLIVYGILFWLHKRWIILFGMEWVWSLIFVAASLDVLGGVAGIAGVARSTNTSENRGIGDAMSLSAVLLMSVGLVLGVCVFFGLPSEDSWGEDWHPGYPNQCYYRWNVGRSDSAECSTLRDLAVHIWCTFVGFLLRILVLSLTQWSVWRAKHGDPPSPHRYVVLNDPVITSTYYPNYYTNTPYLVTTSSSSSGGIGGGSGSTRVVLVS